MGITGYKDIIYWYFRLMSLPSKLLMCRWIHINTGSDTGQTDTE